MERQGETEGEERNWEGREEGRGGGKERGMKVRVHTPQSDSINLSWLSLNTYLRLPFSV